MWRSLVSRLVRVQEAWGSNPHTPTKKEDCQLWRSSFFIGTAGEPQASCISIRLAEPSALRLCSLGFESPHSDQKSGIHFCGFRIFFVWGFELCMHQSGGLMLPPVRKLAATLQLRLAKLPESHRLRHENTLIVIQ